MDSIHVSFWRDDADVLLDEFDLPCVPAKGDTVILGELRGTITEVVWMIHKVPPPLPRCQVQVMVKVQ